MLSIVVTLSLLHTTATLEFFELGINSPGFAYGLLVPPEWEVEEILRAKQR